MTTPPFDVPRAHRWFAVELNNLAWELVEAPQRSEEETERMISAAHGARFHWCEVGTLVNKLRAESLLATTYLAAGDAEMSLRYGELARQRSAEAGEEQTAFDLACVHGVLAQALARVGRADEARREYALALQAIERCEDPDDKPVFEKLYPLVA